MEGETYTPLRITSRPVTLSAMATPAIAHKNITKEMVRKTRNIRPVGMVRRFIKSPSTFVSKINIVSVAMLGEVLSNGIGY